MLLVSDCAVASAVQNLLVEIGQAAPLVCHTLEEALDNLASDIFDLVLVETKIKGTTTDGLLAARRISDRCESAIIILANPGDSLVVDEGIPPFQAILYKPLDSQVLASNIDLAKRTRSAIRQLQREKERVPTFYRSLVNTTPDAIYLIWNSTKKSCSPIRAVTSY